MNKIYNTITPPKFIQILSPLPETPIKILIVPKQSGPDYNPPFILELTYTNKIQELKKIDHYSNFSDIFAYIDNHVYLYIYPFKNKDYDDGNHWMMVE